MNQYTDMANETLGQRLDSVRNLLTNPNLNTWARAYWTQVERSLTRTWKARSFHSLFA